MNRISVSLALLVSLFFFFSCSNEEIVPQQQTVTDNSEETSEASARIGSILRYVSTSGSDANGDGSSTKPWRTLRYAVTKVPANQGYVLKLSAGTFVESGQVVVPAGVSIEGSGIDATFLKAVSSFYYYPSTPGYSPQKYLLLLSSSSSVSGNQSIGYLTIDGDAKKVHGGIYVRYRNNVVIENVKVQNVNFNGIWLYDVKDSQLNNSKIINSSWGSTSYCSGALNVGNLERVTANNLYVDESRGYGVKAIGPTYNKLSYFKIKNSRVSVNPYGLWDNGKAPNIAIEFFISELLACEISGTYVDNTISVVTSNTSAATGVLGLRIYNNIFDMAGRSQGKGYSIELTVNDVEIDHNYFNKGKWGIANWEMLKSNWSIHHNTFYQIESSSYPSEILRSQKNGLLNVKFYNNTIEMAGTRTTNVIGIYGGSGRSVYVRNNIFINNNTSYSYYPNQFVHLENGASMSDFQVGYNFFYKLPIGSVPGTYTKNQKIDPVLLKTGSRPSPYYVPASSSPVINAGTYVGYPYSGTAPDVGAFEYQ